MQIQVVKFMAVLFMLGVLPFRATAADDLAEQIGKDYEQHLGALFEHFHRNPELSFEEFDTAARLAQVLGDTGARC